jgi:ADP-sugar diphosphatase
MAIRIRNVNVPMQTKYNQLEQYLPLVLEFKPFIEWQQQMSLQMLQNQTLRKIVIQDVDMFGKRIGFLKFKAEMEWEDGTPIPGIVFCRGDSVGIFLVLNTGHEDPYVVLVQQPRIPIATMDFLELPAGMLDGSDSFVGVAAQELKEECGIEIHERDLILLSRLAPSPGGCDEFLSIFKAELNMSEKEAQELEGRLGGLREHGERIRIRLVRKSKLYETKSMSILAALALYDQQKK